MDYVDFLKKMDENVVRISSKQLNEEEGDDGASLVQQAEGADKWYYVPAKEYGGFRYLVIENSPDDWAVYFLDKGLSTGNKAVDFGRFDAERMGLQRNDNYDPEEFQRENREVRKLGKYLNEGKGEANGVDLNGYTVQRVVEGDFKKILLACVDIVKKG